MTYDPSTYIGRRIYYRGMFEEHIARVIQSELKEGQTFIDVGANIGVHTLTASYAAGSTGRVVAYEPQSDLLDSLRNDLASNSLSNVTLVGAALGEHQTRLKLYVPHLQNPGLATLAPCSDSASPAIGEVDVVSLDSELERLSVRIVDVLKVDVEGFELEVLKGARVMLATDPPRIILAECIDSHLKRAGASSEELVDFLRKFGYEISAYRRGRWERLAGAGSKLDADIKATRMTRSSVSA